MGKAEDNKRLKRNSLLVNSYKLFTTKGIHDTSISDIASSAGVAKGTFYFYFKDKQDIVDHLIARKSEALLIKALNDLKVREDEDPDLDTVDKIIILADSIVTALSGDPKLVRFLDKNLSVGFYKKAITDESLITAVDVKKEYARIINSGGEKWTDEMLMVYTIIEFISGTAHSVILDSQPVDLDTYKPYMFACIRKICEVFKA